MNQGNCENNIRRRQLAAIHVGKKALRMADEAYRELLWNTAGVRSAADLDASDRRAVLEAMRRLGFVDGKAKRSHAGRPHNIGQAERGPQLRKIEAFLLEAGRPWAYADELARRICKVDRLAWCNGEQLRKVIAALAYDAKRNGRRVK